MLAGNISRFHPLQRNQRSRLVERIVKLEDAYNQQMCMLQDKYMRPLQQDTSTLSLSEYEPSMLPLLILHRFLLL